MDQSGPGPEDSVRSVQARAMLAAGESISSVARALRTNRATVRRWRDGGPSMVQPSRSMVQAAEATVAARVEVLTTMAEGQRALAAGITEATEKLFEKMRSAEKDADQIKAACEILDRAGLVKQSHLEVNHTGGVTFDVTELRAKIRRAREASERAQLTAQGSQGAK